LGYRGYKLLKYKIRGVCSGYGKTLAHTKKSVTHTLINNINKLAKKRAFEPRR